jgi:hypothetical protein
LEEEEDPFVLRLVFFPFDEETVLASCLRLGVLGGISGRRTMVGGEVQDTLLCLVVGVMVF